MGASSGLDAGYERSSRMLRDFNVVYERGSASAKMPDASFQVLWFLLDLGEGCLQRDVCDYSGIGKQTVNSAVHKLADQGILRLEPTSKGRGVRLFLTEGGRAFAEERVLPFLEADREAFGALPERDREELVRVSQDYLGELEWRYAAVEEEMRAVRQASAAQAPD